MSVPPKLPPKLSVRPPLASSANVTVPLPDSVKGPLTVGCVGLSKVLSQAWDCQVKSRVSACAGRAKMMRTDARTMAIGFILGRPPRRLIVDGANAEPRIVRRLWHHRRRPRRLARGV